MCICGSPNLPRQTLHAGNYRRTSAVPVDFQVVAGACAGEIQQHAVELRFVVVILARVRNDNGVELLSLVVRIIGLTMMSVSIKSPALNTLTSGIPTVAKTPPMSSAVRRHLVKMATEFTSSLCRKSCTAVAIAKRISAALLERTRRGRSPLRVCGVGVSVRLGKPCRMRFAYCVICLVLRYVKRLSSLDTLSLSKSLASSFQVLIDLNRRRLCRRSPSIVKLSVVECIRMSSSSNGDTSCASSTTTC